MPELDRFYREAADKAAVLVVAPSNNEGGMRDLMMAGRYTFPVMLDEGDLASAYKVRYVPDSGSSSMRRAGWPTTWWAASISLDSISSWMTSKVNDPTG